tara:strand:- start:16655 stop:18694 length:2040 start_codon:yes stop_codon:yes gene_type:complete
MKKNQTIIIGASGFLGKRIVKKYDSEKILCTYNENYIENGIKFNATNMDFEETIGDLSRYSKAILVFAMQNPNHCAKNIEYSNLLNIISIKKILNYLKKYDIKPIFLSSEFVFDGKKGNYNEKDKAQPVILYGSQKLEIENYIQSNFKKYLIFRISKVFSSTNEDNVSHFSGFLKNIEQNDEFYAAYDQIYNPIHAEDVAEIIFQISEKNLNGIFNAAGLKSYSRYELIKKTLQKNSKFNKKNTKLIKCKFYEAGNNLEKWPLNTTMNMDKTISKVDIKFKNPEDAISEIIKERNNQKIKLTKNKIPFRDLSVTDSKIKKELLNTVDKVLTHGRIINGPEVSEFEKYVSRKCGTKYAVGVSSGSTALYLALKALGIGPGDEVITTPLTWAATTNAITENGAKPVFVDIGQDLNINVDLIKNSLTNKTKAILPVHFTGRLCKMKEIVAIAKKNNLFVIEDAAQAYGSHLKGKMSGSFGDLGCFSMNPMKNFESYGDSGAITANKEKFKNILTKLRHCGTDQKQDCLIPSLNYRIDTIQAAMMKVTSKYSDKKINRIRAISKYYNDKLKNIIDCPLEDDTFHSYYSYTIKVNDRKSLIDYLNQKNIETKIQHPILMMNLTAYKKNKKYHLPTANRLVKKILSLPNHDKMTNQQVEYVADTIYKYYKKTGTSVFLRKKISKK